MVRLIDKTFILLISLFFVIEAQAFSCADEDIIADEFLVRVQSGVSQAGAQKAGADFGSYVQALGGNSDLIGIKKSVVAKGTQKATQSTSTFHLKMPESDLLNIETYPGVLSIEPNCKVQLFAMPTDPLVNQQWGLKNIRAPMGWNYSTSAEKIIVAVSDTGVEFDHEDLLANMWKNPGETGTDSNNNDKATNGVDDDNNGYVDDVHGADIAEGDGDPRPGLARGSEHGTHVAGIVGAVGGNGFGGTGVAWSIQLMAVKGFRDNDGVANIADLIKTIYYAVDNGAHIINCSWGARRAPSNAEIDAVNYAVSKNVMIVAAAGNSTENASSITPASIPGVISVGSINSRSELSGFSNFGPHVKFVAPGGEISTGSDEDVIISTVPMSRGAYGPLRGTSMASPYVAGTFALIKALRPTWTAGQIATYTQKYADQLDLVAADKNRTQGTYYRINLEKTLQALVVGNELDIDENFSFATSPGGKEPVKSNAAGCGMKAAPEMNVSSRVFSMTTLFYLVWMSLPLFLLFKVHPRRIRVKIKKP